MACCLASLSTSGVKHLFLAGMDLIWALQVISDLLFIAFKAIFESFYIIPQLFFKYSKDFTLEIQKYTLSKNYLKNKFRLACSLLICWDYICGFSMFTQS